MALSHHLLRSIRPTVAPTSIPTLQPTINSIYECSGGLCVTTVVLQAITGYSKMQWESKSMNAAYARELARLLGISPTSVSTIIAPSSARDYQRMLQSGQSSFTVQSEITSSVEGKDRIRTLLVRRVGSTVNAELDAFSNRLGLEGVQVGTFNVITATSEPIQQPTEAPASETAVLGINGAGNAGNNLPMTTIIAIVVVVIVVAIAAAVVFYTMSKSNKNDARGSLVAALHNNYKGKDEFFGGASPAFAPHIARGTPSQRYSGSSAGRRSIGNNIELADYRASGYGDADDRSVASENPYFASPRLSLTRKSLAEHQLKQGSGHSPQYLRSADGRGNNPMHGVKGSSGLTRL